jgi:hypothetical protein
MAKVTGSRSSCRSRRDLKQRQFEFNLKFSPLTQQRFFRWAACYGLLFVGRLICYINSASIVGRRINSQYSTIIRVNSQQSTVNNNSGATGIDIISLGKRHTVSSNRGFPGCTGGRGQSVLVGSDRAHSGARQSRSLCRTETPLESTKRD